MIPKQRRQKIIEIRAEINKIEKENWFFEKINTIDKPHSHPSGNSSAAQSSHSVTP